MAIPPIRTLDTAARYDAIDAERVSKTRPDTDYAADEPTADHPAAPTPSRDVPAPHATAAHLAARSMERRLRRSLADAPAGSAEVSAAAPPSAATATGAVPTPEPAPPRSPVADAAVLERLNFALTQWVDEGKARPYADSPSALLRAVATHRQRAIPMAFETTLDPSLLADEAVLDEAALLYDRLRRMSSADGTPSASPPAANLPTLRASFLAALKIDYPKRRALDALLAPSASFAQTTPYFDGFALRHAEGMSFDDLLHMQALWSGPVLADYPQAERRALLAQKFDEMGESIRFPIGSEMHSMASALLRIERYRGAPPTRYVSESELAKAFAKIDSAWKEGDTYPYHPRLLFAAHLARSSGVEVLSLEQLTLLYENQVHDRALEMMADGDAKPAEWIGRFLSESTAPGANWQDAAPARKAQVLLGLFDALRTAADRDEPISPFAREIRAKGILSPNRLIGADFDARTAAVIGYANERLIVAYGEPPSFDRRDAAIAILGRAGIAPSDMTDQRHYSIAGDNPSVTKAAFGDLIDEFLDRADWVGLNGASMRLPNGQSLRPRDALQREEQSFNASLPSDPWVVALAKERLRARSAAATPEAVATVAGEIAGNLATETEQHRALVRGLETWVNTLPVAGPIYNIEEGVRHRDAARAAFGLLFLGADVFDLSTGGGGAHPSAAHPIVPKLRHALRRVDASQINVAGHAELVEMAVDPVHLAQPDANVPPELRGLARQAREHRNVRWRGYDVVHLDLEDRIVPVGREGDLYFEVDWYTRHRLRDTPAIELDLQANTARFREAHSQSDRTPIAVSDLQARVTVQGVKALLERADDTTLREFQTLFADAFAQPRPAANASRFDAPAFYRKLYESSDTFRRLFNRHAQVDARARNGTTHAWKKWEFAIGEVGPLGAPSKAYTDFEHKRIYMPSDAAIQAMPYMTAGGPRTMSSEQAYLHEMIHALTGGRDPERAIDLRNRGPIVYLTDKILNEAGYDFAEQVMYRRSNSTSDMPVDQTIEYNAGEAARTAGKENRYLDALLDAKRGTVTADTLVEGVPVLKRMTVADTQAALDEIEGVQDEAFLAWGEFKTKFDRNFGFYVQDRTVTTELASDAMVVVDFYGRLYQRSVTFRRMFDKMPVTEASQADPWKFVLEGDIDFQALSPGGRAHGIEQAQKKIYVLDDGMAYLAETGLREVEIERKLAYQMVCAATGIGKVPTPQAYANRGAAVYLTDRILQEAGFNYPRQLVAALAGPNDVAAQAQLAARQTAAMRSAWVEDRYMKLG
ncbi:hypothetical protein [Trinickia sp.]|uniref:hypothetical protein n=1 Tax=Trinickia sp. TaxID=2571163 RepID=UPI003F7E4AB3